jgi:formylglycine-generating enzyme required for sulfatase activity
LIRDLHEGANGEGVEIMKWYTSFIVGFGLCLVLGVSVSQGEWMMRVYQGANVEERALADIDSLNFYDAPPSGSRCMSDGSCTVTRQAACTGVWTEAGLCTPNPCPPPSGSCCYPDGSCQMLLQAACPGVWTMFGVCTPNPCPPTGMVLIPAGTFTMGSPGNEPGRNSDEVQHQVTLTHAMYVFKYEVTQSEWLAVMGWNTSGHSGANLPVETVTWYDAVSYCNQRSAGEGLAAAYTITDATYSGNHITSATVTWNQAANGYRLLTEAEWEYACRATSTTAFCNGAITNTGCSPLDLNLDQVGWYCGNASSTTHDVGGKTANFWGLKDMHGNVWELCWDWYGAYPAGPLTDPTGPASGGARVMRGGSFVNTAMYGRSALRGNYYSPGSPQYHLGLRLCRTAP